MNSAIPSVGDGLSVGMDLVEIPRFRRLVNRWRDRFLSRVFTDMELALAGGRVESLAARFAAKEAFAKALGLGLAGFGWRDVEVTASHRGKPELRLHNKAAKLADDAGFDQFLVSLTHTASLAAAVVIARKAGVTEVSH